MSVFLKDATYSPKGGIGLVTIKVLYSLLLYKISKTWTETEKLDSIYYNDNSYSIS